MNLKNNFLKQIASLFIIINAIQLQRSSATEYRQKYCSDEYIDFDKSIQKYEDERDKVDNEFYNNYMEIIDALQGKSTTSNLFKSFTLAAIFLILFLIASLISIFVFFIFCCGKCRQEKNYKPYLITTLISFVLMIVLFILILVFVGLSQYYVDDFLCSTFKIPSILIDGANDSEIQFAGLETYRKTFKNFKLEQNNLATSLSDFQGIINTKINEKSLNLLTQTNNFVSQTQQIKVPDMSSVEKVPNSGSQMNIGINNEISTEIESLSIIGSKLNSASQIGQTFVLAPVRSLVDTALIQVDANLERIITKIENLMEPITDDMENVKKYIIASIWTIFAFFIVIIILLTWVIVIATCYNTKNKCLNQLQCGRTILVILSIFLFVLGILLFVLATGSVVLSSACGFIVDLNRDKVELLYKFENLNKDSLKAAEICLFSNSTGDMTELAASEIDVLDQSVKGYMMSIYEILEGFTSYRLWYDKQDSQQIESKEMLNLETKIDSLGINGQGSVYDFYQVEDTLEEFNDLVSCSDQNYQLKTKNCENQSTCKVIGTNLNFESPTCSNDQSKASSLFTTLKNYATQENTYIDTTTNNLISLSLPESPNSSFKEFLSSLKSLNGNSQNIENKISGTLQPIIETGNSWMDIEDCRQLRKLMIEFEVVTCHHLNYNVYIFFVVVFIASYLLFLMLWMIFCLLRKRDSDNMKVQDNFYSNDTGQVKELNDEHIPMS